MRDLPALAGIELEINNIFEYCEKPLTREEEEKIDQYLEMLGEQEAEKVDRICAFMRSQKGRAELMRQEAARLEGKARAMEERINYLKGHYIQVMTGHNLKKIRGGAYSMSLRKSEFVRIMDKSEVAQAGYADVETVITPDKKSIMAAIKAGERVPGAELGSTQYLVIS